MLISRRIGLDWFGLEGRGGDRLILASQTVGVSAIGEATGVD